MPLLNVNNTTYDYPDPGSEPGWGEGATDWASAVTEVISSLLAPGDITKTESNILDNQLIAQDVVSLVFDASSVRAANIEYVVNRTDGGSTVLSESGTLYLTYNSGAAPGSKYSMSQMKNGEAGIVFSVLDSGQVQYISTVVGGGANYVGTIIFKARTLSQ